MILARFEATGDPAASFLNYLLRFRDDTNEDASIVNKFIAFLDYMGNRDPVTTGTGFINPEGSIPTTRCSCINEQGSIIIFIDRIDPVSTNDCAFNWLVSLIMDQNLGSYRSSGV